MRIRVPIDQIELLNAEINKTDNRLAQDRSILSKAWSTILLESLVKVRINAKFVQSNVLAGRLQSSDADLTRYLKRVVSDFLEADNRNTSAIKKIADSSKVLSRDGAVSIRDRLLNSKKMYIALALLGPLALLYPAATALMWIKERMAAKNSAIPVGSTVEKNSKKFEKQSTEQQSANKPEALTEEEHTHDIRLSEEDEQFKLPDFVYNNAGYSKDANGYDTYTFLAANGVVSAVYVWNSTGQISCTFYTLRKLRDRGLGYPFKQAGSSGGQWFDNCTDDVTKISGNDALKEIIAGYDLPVKNIVISFPDNPSVNGRTDYGHVVLIDEIDVHGNIIFSDNIPSIPDKFGFNSQKTVTLEQFVNMYSEKNGNMVGAVIIGE